MSQPARPPAKRRKSRLVRYLKILVVTATFGVLALAAALVIGYRMVDVPTANEEFQAEKTFVYYADGRHVLGSYASQDRINVALADVPDHVQQAVVAAENRTFWTDNGIDPKSILRAAWGNLTSDSTQGASTITQQYVKILYLSQERSWQRKVKEAFLAVKIENSMSKSEILQGYLNTIYFGRGAYGIEAAALAYFDEHVGELDVAQGAVLAAVLNSPASFDPAGGKANRRALLERYRYVLDGMAAAGDVSADRAARYAERLPDFPVMEVKNELGGPRGYLLALVEQQLRQQGFSEEEIYGGGLNVVTTFDWQAQVATRTAVRKEAPTIKGRDVHIAIASVEPGTGALRAMYGGRDYVKDQRNWAMTGRQPGSSFKPFALAAGLESGISLFDTVNGNTYVFPDGTTVRNEFGYQYGPISVLTATEISSNTGYADLTTRIGGGPRSVLRTAVRAGIPADTPGLRANSVIALGTADVPPVDMASAYATFAARGTAAPWYAVEKVTDTAGDVRYSHRTRTTAVFRPGVAADVTHALTQVVEDPSGTGTAAQALRCPAAAKTGTAALRPDTVTSAWFVGYTPKLSTAVMYVKGKDGTADLDGVGGLSTFFGGEYPADTWTTYMNEALRGQPCGRFPKPAFVSGPPPAPTPTFTPTPTPTPSPTPSPSPTPTPTPTPTPSPTPTPTPTPSPTPSPSPTPTPTPSSASSGPP